MGKQKSGLYRAKVTVGHDTAGNPIVKYASGKTKKELEENKQELIRRYIGGMHVERDVMFADSVISWYTAYKEPTLSVSSKSCYKSIINKHILPAFKDRQIKSITAPELQIFLNTKSGLSVSTLGYIKAVLTGVFKNAYTNGIIDRDPSATLVRPSAQKESKRALTQAEVIAVLEVGRTHPEGMILLILYYTGLRIGEALGLQWRDVDFKERVLSVNRDIDFKTNAIGELKTKSAKRSVPIPQELYDALWLARGIGETFVIQSPKSHSFLSQSTYKRMWSRLMQAVYEIDRSIENRNGKAILTAHYFRHNYASVLYNNGIDILSAQKYLGHSDVKTTLGIYSHLSVEKEKENANKVRQAFS